MNVLIHPKPQSIVNAVLIFFVVHAMQIGVGVQGFQRVIFLEAGHDAWISVLISGIATQFIAWTMIRTLALYESTDLYGIQYDVFGKWLGNMLNLLFVFYCLGAFFILIRNYIEVIQAWVFPDFPTWFLSITILFLVAYGLSGGLRTIIGVSFFSVILSLWILLLLAFPLQFANFDFLFPLFEASLVDILMGAKQMTFTVVGFEIIYFVYPFLKEKKSVNKYMQLGLLFTTLLYLALMIISLSYFSPGQMTRAIWATLSMFKIVRLPFIERFEYVAITYWIILILPNLMLYIWAASRGIGRIFNKCEKKIGWGLMVLIFFTMLIPCTRVGINMANDYFSKAAFYMIYCYPLLLFAAALIKNKFFQKEGGKEG